MNGGAVHVRPVVVKSTGMIAVTAAVVTAFGGGGPQPGRASLVLIGSGSH